MSSASGRRSALRTLTVRAALLGLTAPAWLGARAYAATLAASATAPTIMVSSAVWRNAPNSAFLPGEECHFIITWGVVVAGRATLAVEPLAEVAGRPTYHIVASAQSTGMVDAFYKVRDQNESWLDAGSLTSVRFDRHIHEGKYRIEETTNIDQINHRFALHAFRIDKNTYENKQGTVPPDVLDVLGSLYDVRTLPLKMGASYTIDVLSGEKIYPLVVAVRKRERIKVPAGRFRCLLVEPQLRQPGIFISKGKKLEVWLTDDAAHMPVRMRSEVFIGHVAADLLSYRKSSGE